MTANHYHVTRSRTGRIVEGWTCDEPGEQPGSWGQPESVVIDATGLTDAEASQKGRARLVAVFGEAMV